MPADVDAPPQAEDEQDEQDKEEDGAPREERRRVRHEPPADNRNGQKSEDYISAPWRRTRWRAARVPGDSRVLSRLSTPLRVVHFRGGGVPQVLGERLERGLHIGVRVILAAGRPAADDGRRGRQTVLADITTYQLERRAETRLHRHKLTELTVRPLTLRHLTTPHVLRRVADIQRVVIS